MFSIFGKVLHCARGIALCKIWLKNPQKKCAKSSLNLTFLTIPTSNALFLGLRPTVQA